MKIYSLTGKSGTGKSFQALTICRERGIESLIDDGLFIYHDSVAGGLSAKRQKTKIKAIKTALFNDPVQAQLMREKIREYDPASILIIGTSDRMTDIICDRLGLPPVAERIYIEDVTTPEEREAAAKQRDQQGKHVIPVPTLQLKRDFAGYFMDPMKLLRKAKSVSGAVATEALVQEGLSRVLGGEVDEKTVVRPTYSYIGDFFIADSVVTDIADCVGKEVPGIAGVIGVFENTAPDELKVFVAVKLEKTADVWQTAERFQRRLREAIEYMTAFNVESINVEVRGLVRPS